MLADLSTWLVIGLWILLALAALGILWATARSSLKGMEVVLGPPRQPCREKESDQESGTRAVEHPPEAGGDDDGDSVEDDHDRGAPER